MIARCGPRHEPDYHVDNKALPRVAFAGRPEEYGELPSAGAAGLPCGDPGLAV
jgi:hypothetical protein